MNIPKLKLVYTHVFMACREEGEQLPPWYYGLSYHDYCRNFDVFHVMPLNFIIRFGMFIAYKWNRFRSKPTRQDLVIAAALWGRNTLSDCEIDKQKEEELHSKAKLS